MALSYLLLLNLHQETIGGGAGGRGVRHTGHIGGGSGGGNCFFVLFCFGPIRAFIETEQQQKRSKENFFVCLYKHSRNTSQHL